MTNHSLEEELTQEISDAYNTLKNYRGEPNQELDQYYITEESSLQRASLVNPKQYDGKRIILLGDMVPAWYLNSTVFW